MTIALWITAGIVFWFACGYLAARLEYSMFGKDRGEMMEAFILGPVGIIWTVSVYINRSESNFWQKFLRMKD